MIIIGEKINTTRKEVAEAVRRKDAAFIRSLARRQTDAGAKYIDVNCGSGDFAEVETELLPWMVQEIQDELDGAPLCLDSNSPQALLAALKVHQGKALLNASFSGEKYRYEPLEPLLEEYRPGIVCLCIDDEHGIPETSEIRFQIADGLIRKLGTLGIDQKDIYIDPLVQPISVDKNNGLLSSLTIRMIRDKYPQVHAVCGLSNISFELPERKLLNQAFMLICAANGLDAVIMNPEDKAMMRLVYAADTLLGNDNYCKKYIKAYRKGLLSQEYTRERNALPALSPVYARERQ